MKRIDRVEVRVKLPIRRDPHWYRLSEGRYVGFRKMTPGTPGMWLARRYDGEKYQYKSLDEPAGMAEKDRFDAAKREAEKWFQDGEAGVPAKSGNVKQACEAYVEKQRQKSASAANDASGRFTRLLYSDPIGRVELGKLQPRNLAEWKARVLARSEKNGDGNALGSFNRNATALRAALNLAHDRREVASDLAWSQELKPFEGTARRRELYLDRDKRRKLLESATDEARDFFKVLALQPLRPGDVAKLKVAQFDARQRSLSVPTGKSKARIIPLGSDAVTHFKACAKGKLPSAWLVSRADGSQWKKEAWRDEIKIAAATAKLPRATVAYTLRHSVITDLVKGGLDIFHVAKLAGTSVKMIEEHYGHLQNEHARKALQKLALV